MIASTWRLIDGEDGDADEAQSHFPRDSTEPPVGSIAFNAVTSRLGGREGREAMKPELHQNEGNEISSAPQVAKPNGVIEPSPAARRDSHLAKGSEVIGTVFFAGPAVVDGQMEGEISGEDEITVGEDGSITSDELRAPSVVIAGTVKVKTIASRRVEILATGKVWGDLASPVLNIHEGAHFEGSAFVPKAK
jgi:cytoskeletal protein CcmA (bactofilin family)